MNGLVELDANLGLRRRSGRRLSMEDHMSWTWQYQTADGTPLDEDALTTAPAVEIFPSQSDAESWLGEVWKELLHAGVEQVVLRDGDREVYGPMPLRAAD
jgi:hypothetical protein